MKNLNLIDEYNGILEKDDFGDAACRDIYEFLVEYRNEFGTCFSKENASMLYYKMLTSKRILCSHLRSASKFLGIIDSIRRLGTEDAQTGSPQFESVKKFSLLRKLNSTGIDTEVFFKNERVENIAASEIVDRCYSKLDELSNSLAVKQPSLLCENIVERAKNFLDKPEQGLNTPFSFINTHMHGLCNNDLTLIGGLSNTGKGRFLIYLLVYLVCIENQTVCFISNEMSEEDIFKAMVCSIINMPEIQAIFDYDYKLPQANITQTLFYDEHGDLIKRTDFPSSEAFEECLKANSPIYKKYIETLKWFEDKYSSNIYYVNVADDYSIERIKREVKTAQQYGCSVVAYDTLKAYRSAEWGDLAVTATAFSECIKTSEGLHGIATFQLTDSSHNTFPEELNSNNIAISKHIMHVADNMLMFIELSKSIKNRYKLENEELDINEELPKDKTIYAFRIIKNRRGSGKDDKYAVQVDLDINRWKYVGKLI